jgi:hypothetical protein
MLHERRMVMLRTVIRPRHAERLEIGRPVLTSTWKPDVGTLRPARELWRLGGSCPGAVLHGAPQRFWHTAADCLGDHGVAR